MVTIAKSQMRESLLAAEEQSKREIAERKKSVLDSKKIDAIKKYNIPSLQETESDLFIGGLITRVYETIGKRPTQEDHFIQTATSILNSADIPEFLEKAFDRINKKTIEAAVPDGSTANVAYISAGKGRTVTVANTGDSRTVLFIRNIKTGKIETIRLSLDHKPDEPQEKARIEAAGGKVIKSLGDVYRVTGDGMNGAFSLSRAFGDFSCKGTSGEHLLTYKPDITSISLERILSDPDLEVFLVNSCDGLYETLHERDLAQLMSEYLGIGQAKEKKEGLSKLFAKAAFYTGSRDNITVNVVEIPRQQIQDVVIGVFDGHGGAKTSSIAAEEMLAISKELHAKTQNISTLVEVFANSPILLQMLFAKLGSRSENTAMPSRVEQLQMQRNTESNVLGIA